MTNYEDHFSPAAAKIIADLNERLTALESKSRSSENIPSNPSLKKRIADQLAMSSNYDYEPIAYMSDAGTIIEIVAEYISENIGDYAYLNDVLMAQAGRDYL